MLRGFGFKGSAFVAAVAPVFCVESSRSCQVRWFKEQGLKGV